MITQISATIKKHVITASMNVTKVMYQIKPVVDLEDGPVINMNSQLTNHYRVTLHGNRYLNAPMFPLDGAKIVLDVVQDGVGGRTLALDPIFEVNPAIGLIVLSAQANRVDTLGMIYDGVLGKWKIMSFIAGFQ